MGLAPTKDMHWTLSAFSPLPVVPPGAHTQRGVPLKGSTNQGMLPKLPRDGTSLLPAGHQLLLAVGQVVLKARDAACDVFEDKTPFIRAEIDRVGLGVLVHLRYAKTRRKSHAS